MIGRALVSNSTLVGPGRKDAPIYRSKTMKPFAYFNRDTSALRFETARDLRNARLGEQREIPLYTTDMVSTAEAAIKQAAGVTDEKETERMKERSKDFERRVKVEEYLLDVFKGKKPPPDKTKCKELAFELGIPDEYRTH